MNEEKSETLFEKRFCKEVPKELLIRTKSGLEACSGKELGSIQNKSIRCLYCPGYEENVEIDYIRSLRHI